MERSGSDRPRRGLVLAAGCLVALCACTPARPPDVVMIVTDTLRRDRLATFGGEPGLMPTLDGLARRATSFRNAYSSAAWTSPAIASLFTSRLPSQHGIDRFESVLADEEQTLAEALAARGYRTAAFSANALIRADLGYDQGFAHFETGAVQSEGVRVSAERAIATVGRALAWLEELPAEPAAPIFLYLQLMDPHTPYRPARLALRHVFGAGPLPDLDRVNDWLWSEEPLEPAMRATLEQLYDAEARSLDFSIGVLLTVLERTDRLDHALVIVTADHGEELWDHGMQGHGHSLYDELIRVPLIVQRPGQVVPRQVDTPVSLIDLAPTVLEAAGAARPEAFEGRSLWPRILGAARPAQARVPVVSELLRPPALRRGAGHQRAVVLGDDKLIVDLDGARHYFDRSADPHEQGEATLPAPRRGALDQALEHVVAGLPEREPAERVPLDDRTRAELRALGYVE